MTARAHPGRTRAAAAKTAETPDSRVVSVEIIVHLTRAEAEALRDGVLVCTSEDPAVHHAARRALRKIRDRVSRLYPRPPTV